MFAVINGIKIMMTVLKKLYQKLPAHSPNTERVEKEKSKIFTPFSGRQNNLSFCWNGQLTCPVETQF